MLETTLEELKSVVHDKLQQNRAEQPEAGGLRMVYLVFEEQDADAVQDIDDYLYDRGFEVKRPLFDGDDAKLRADHRDKLRIADGVLLFVGAADAGWLSRMLLDLAETPSPKRASAVYLAGPETKQKARYRTREVDEVIKAFDGFTPEFMNGFLDRFETDQ